MRVPGFKFSFRCKLQAPSNVYSGRQQIREQIIGSLHSTLENWDTLTVSLAPGYMPDPALVIVDVMGATEHTETFSFHFQ